MGSKTYTQGPWPMPRNWMKRCTMRKYYPWCSKWADSLTPEQKIWLNCGHPPRKLDAALIGRITDDCKYLSLSPPQIQECIKSESFISSLHKREKFKCPKPDKAKLKGAKRAANLDSHHSGSLAVGLSLGAVLLILLVGVIAYWYFFGRQKSDRPPKGASKGGSKTGKSKLGKSKLGKSKLGSRKSSQRSSRKGSLQSKATKSAKKK